MASRALPHSVWLGFLMSWSTILPPRLFWSVACMASRALPHSVWLGFLMSWSTILLQLECSLHGVQSTAPFSLAGILNVLEHNSSSTLVLVCHEFLSMFTFLIRRFLEKTLQIL